ncbi:MAG: metallophosphoesterase [Victivallales bacterium]|nr:metallophosphoesterase [Victivallales bacterium]
MRIVHISDIHAAAPPDSLSALFDKRLLGALNHLIRRRFLHDQSLLYHLGEFVLEQKPDVVAITGDVTSTGQPAEFAATTTALKQILDDNSVATIYIPGNHDAYVSNQRCAAKLAETFELLNDEETTLNSLPMLRTIKGVDFIMVNEAFPTNPFLSTGKITNETEKAVENICGSKKTNPRVLVGHFPLRRKLARRRSLSGGCGFLKMLEDGIIDLSLCGHTHEPLLDLNQTGRGEITAGSFTKTRDINIIDFSPDTNVFTVQQKILSPFTTTEQSRISNQVRSHESKG